MDVNSLYLKIANFCAYQDRTSIEVYKKMKLWEFPDELHDQFIELLKEESYLNEERYAKSYSRGKANLKKWGKNKIKLHLQHKGIDPETISDSLQEIDPETYQKNAIKLISKKMDGIKDKSNPIEVKQKIYRFLLSKGFELEAITKAWQCFQLNEEKQ
jgi:regulatory protein